jgi:ankyrin repeat protein
MDIHTALQLHSDHHIVQFLKTAKDVNIRDLREQTPLHVAALEGMHPVVKALLKKKADFNSQDSKGWTPLHCSTNEQHFGVCMLLLQYKADANLCTFDQNSVLHYAVKGRRNPVEQLEFIDSLLEKAPHLLDQANYRGETALLRACMIGSDEAVVHLIGKKADVSSRTKYVKESQLVTVSTHI